MGYRELIEETRKLLKSSIFQEDNLAYTAIGCSRDDPHFEGDFLVSEPHEGVMHMTHRLLVMRTAEDLYSGSRFFKRRSWIKCCSPSGGKVCPALRNRSTVADAVSAAPETIACLASTCTRACCFASIACAMSGEYRRSVS